MKRYQCCLCRPFFCLFFLFFISFSISAFGKESSLPGGSRIVSENEMEKNGGEATKLPDMLVEDSADGGMFVEIDAGAQTTQEIISKRMVETMLNEAQTGSYKALDMLPSANVQTGDAYGLALGKTLRLRGAFKGDEFLRNIEGLPVSSHGGGGDFIDFENIRSIGIYRGAIPTDRSFGVRNMTGGMDLSILWPRDEFGGVVKQSLGDDNFSRTFVRIDSGLFSSGTKVFVSYSTTSADKWRGKGGQPESRDNFEMAVSQRLGSNAKIELFGVHHEMEQHDFRGLSYDQVQNLSEYYDFDYNTKLTGDPSQDQNYYDFTRQSYEDTMLMANFEIALAENGKLTLKPYYWKDEGYRYMGRRGGVMYLTTQPEQYGFTGQYDVTIDPVDLSVGYWQQTIVDCLPPPLGMKMYAINYADDGSTYLSFSNWTSLQKVSDRIYRSVYLTAKTAIGKTTFTGSLKYMYQRDPGKTAYNASGIPDVSYENAFSYNPAVDLDIRAKEKTWEFWEPGFSVNHEFNEDINGYFAYGTGYQFNNWSGLSSSYTNYKDAFVAAGITFDSLWDDLEPERYHNFDMGLRFEGGIFTIAPTLYYSINKNKTVTVYDEIAGVSYQQSDADATSYGAELEMTARAPAPFSGDLLLYFSGSYNHYTYDNDIKNASDNIVRSKGKQIADTPEYMAKLGATYQLRNFSISPMARYIGKRYGDVENIQEADDYVVADLYLTYNTGTIGFLRDVKISLSFINLFDKQYIGLINTSDFTEARSTSYYPGAPLTIMGGVSLAF